MNHIQSLARLMWVVSVSSTLFLLHSNVWGDDYVVSIDGASPRLARIVATMEPDGVGIKMNDEGVHGLERGWATFIEDLEVTGADGTVFALNAKPNSHWDLVGYKNGPVTVSYTARLGHDQVEINFGDNGAAYATPTGVMWAGRALFIAGKPARDLVVQFKVPGNWTVTTPWGEDVESDHGFRVHTTEDLVNSAIFAGTHEQTDLVAGDVTLRVALSGANTLGMSEQINELTGQYLNYYENRFRSPGKSSMVLIAADRPHWGGEVMGRAISISIGGEPPPGFNPLTTLAHVIAHEIFHVFSLIRMEVNDEHGEFQWFHEGFGAEYAAWLARLRLGEISAEEFLAELVNQVTKYEAMVDGDLTLVSAGADKAAKYDMVYSGGFVAAMALDFLVRAQSDGRQSVDDLWVQLLNNYPRGGKALTLAGVIKATREIYGDSIATSLEQYFSSPDVIPFYKNARLMGLEYDGEILSFSGDSSEAQKLLWKGVISR